MTALCLAVLLMLPACSSLEPNDPLNISVVGLEPLPGQGMEMRFTLTLRIQNPNDNDLVFNGLALELQINDQPLASGVSDQQGQVPRFSEALVKVPLTISAYSLWRQAMGASSLKPGQPVRYALDGKLGGGLFSQRFSATGQLDWPMTARP
jgi:hypothetical protein